jgi:hypothetical protein
MFLSWILELELVKNQNLSIPCNLEKNVWLVIIIIISRTINLIKEFRLVAGEIVHIRN